MNNAAKQYQKKNKLMEINLNKLGREQIILFNQIYLNEKKNIY